MMALCGGFCVYAVVTCLPVFSLVRLYSEGELAFNLVRHFVFVYWIKNIFKGEYQSGGKGRVIVFFITGFYATFSIILFHSLLLLLVA